MKRAFLAITAILAATASNAAATEILYSFDFDLTKTFVEEHVTISYVSEGPTNPGDIFANLTQIPLFNFWVLGSRQPDGSWFFQDTGDPHFSYSFTAFTDLVFPNAPGVYDAIPAQLDFSCFPCFGVQPGTYPATVNIQLAPVPEPANRGMAAFALLVIACHFGKGVRGKNRRGAIASKAWR